MPRVTTRVVRSLLVLLKKSRRLFLVCNYVKFLNPIKTANSPLFEGSGDPMVLNGQIEDILPELLVTLDVITNTWVLRNTIVNI